jgi:hypothetical protein
MVRGCPASHRSVQSPKNQEPSRNSWSSSGQITVNPVQLVRWIKNQVELDYIVKAANSTPALYQRADDELIISHQQADVVGNELRSGKAKLREFFWPSAQSMRGKCFGTKSFDDTCGKAANTMAGSTAWDAISTVPFVQFALADYLKAFAMPTAVGISIGLMMLSNVAGKLGANRAKGREMTATAGLALFILLSSVKTLLSGVGFDILVNKSGITKEYARSVVAYQLADKQKTLDQLQTLNNPKLLNFERSCDALKAQLQKTDKDLQPRAWENLWVQAFGTFEQQESMRGSSNAEILQRFGGINQVPGVCKRFELQQSEDLAQASALQAKLSEWNFKIGSTPPLAFLKADFPDVYNDEFVETDSGQIEIRSGQTVVSQAFQQFFDKLNDPKRILELGVSLFWMAVSIILSILATILLWALSRSKEMKMSYETRLLPYTLQLLQAYQENLPRALDVARQRRAADTNPMN